MFRVNILFNSLIVSVIDIAYSVYQRDNLPPVSSVFPWFLTSTCTELDLQGPENLIGGKRYVFFAGITSLGVPLSPSFAAHKAFHAFKKALISCKLTIVNKLVCKDQ